MYVHEKMELPVPPELNLHFEMIKVRLLKLWFVFLDALLVLTLHQLHQSIRHLCQMLCELPSAKNAVPLLNYACRTGSNELFMFCLKMGGNVTQVQHVAVLWCSISDVT